MIVVSIFGVRSLKRHPEEACENLQVSILAPVIPRQSLGTLTHSGSPVGFTHPKSRTKIVG